MLKMEGKVAGLDMNFPRRHENGLEPDALGPNIAMGCGFAALPNRADSRQIFCPESVLITLYNDPIGIDPERDEGQFVAFPREREAIIVGILQKLEDKPSIAAIEVSCKSKSLRLAHHPLGRQRFC